MDDLRVEAAEPVKVEAAEPVDNPKVEAAEPKVEVVEPKVEVAEPKVKGVGLATHPGNYSNTQNVLLQDHRSFSRLVGLLQSCCWF